ncbi:hemocyanin A chain [Trichonephila inaurata madagascariensis]|uniref:Hemocyanin A chain n=1 Tax=Trichonephila inaurata madagascariensis TaxID=2747483 RepID=A0A8X6XVK7_9ARAC|nr:hemocyanin A chain [Trichonephila inaurata madagascariensis]
MSLLHEKQVRVLKLFERLSVAASGEKIPADQIDARLSTVGELPNSAFFSCFLPAHLEEAKRLIEIFYSAKDFDDFVLLAEQARTFVNSTLFAFAAEVAILHRADSRGIIVPPIQEIFADRFVPADTLIRAFSVATTKPAGDESDVIIDVQETGNILDPEYKLAYYREDIGVNAHHWHWHVVYPSVYDSKFFGKKKDRTGELFYYMHQQMCARYDCERLSNGLTRMVPFHNFEEPLEGYAAHLTHIASGRHYAPRPDGLAMTDLRLVDVQDMQRWTERILEAIHLGKVIDSEGNDIILDEETGADILGSLIESNLESKNRQFYGNLHNWGHVMMAYIHDPDGRFRETPGVMTDTATSLRDPIFYRFHRFIDNVFQEYKKTLPVYSRDNLTFPDIEITESKVNAKITNVIHTFIREDELELTHCMNFGSPGSVKARYHHLDHESFSYIINANNNGSEEKKGTVRIFLAPKYDELGNVISLDEQRRLYIEMDKFDTDLRPGKNIIVRSSTDSTVTISSTYTFKELLHGEDLEEDRSEFCSCGWPQHLLVPKGSNKGMVFDLFVMITDAEKDKVPTSGKKLCNDALSYCGVMDEKYPDKRAMGYPFDRTITAQSHEEFITPNMKISNITVRFQD